MTLKSRLFNFRKSNSCPALQNCSSFSSKTSVEPKFINPYELDYVSETATNQIRKPPRTKHEKIPEWVFEPTETILQRFEKSGQNLKRRNPSVDPHKFERSVIMNTLAESLKLLYKPMMVELQES